jgi:hypothetical protein
MHQDGLDIEALEAFEAGRGTLAGILRIEKNDLSALRAQGVALLSSGDFVRSRASFVLLDALGESGPEVDLMIAIASDQLGDRRMALAHAERGLAQAREQKMTTLEALIIDWKKRFEVNAVSEVES